MRKTISKLASVFLVVSMLFTVLPALAFAEDGNENENPTFNLTKISETKTQLVLSVDLVSGGFLCFDATVSTSEDLTCTSIIFSPAYKSFAEKIESEGFMAVNSANFSNGKISIACTKAYDTPSAIATYTFTKNSADGITSSDAVFTIDSCYVSLNGTDTEITPTLTTDLTATHVHVAAGDWTTTKAPTCTATGTEVRYCSECGEIAETRDIDKSAHRTYEVKKAATCTEDGYIKVICDECGETISNKEIAATGHKYIKDYKSSTCTEDGYIKIVCSVCGEVSSSVVVAKTGHSWSDWTVVKEPTYRSQGLEERKCKICGEIEEREIPMLTTQAETLTISMSEFAMHYRQNGRLYATVTPEEAAYSADIVWTSSNPKVVTVDENGNIFASGRGTAVITASTADGSLTSSCTITVTYTTLQWIVRIFLLGFLWY